MYRYSKYIISRIMGPFVLITFSLTAVIWLSQSLRFIEMIINRGLHFSTFLYLSLLTLPSLLWIILPISLFVSILIVYHRLMNDSELVIMKSAGISRVGLAKPVLFVALCTTLLSYIIGLYLLPASYREFKDLQAFIRDNYVSVLLQEGVFVTPIKGLTVYIRERDDDGTLHGLMVHDDRLVSKPSTMMAEQGHLVQTLRGPQFILESGNRQEMNRNNEQLSLLFFDRYVLELDLYTEPAPDRWREAKERFITELFEELPDDKKHLSAKLRAEGHQRITWPLYSLLLSMLALAAFFVGDYNRRGQSYKLLATSVVSVGFVIASFTLTNASASNPVLVPLIYAMVVVGGGFSAYISLGWGRKS